MTQKVAFFQENETISLAPDRLSNAIAWAVFTVSRLSTKLLYLTRQKQSKVQCKVKSCIPTIVHANQ